VCARYLYEMEANWCDLKVNIFASTVIPAAYSMWFIFHIVLDIGNAHTNGKSSTGKAHRE
jgi:hypothetical protein